MTTLEKINSDVAILSRSVARNMGEVKDRMTKLQNMIEMTNGNTFMLTTLLNDEKENLQLLSEKFDSLEKRLNAIRATILEEFQ